VWSVTVGGYLPTVSLICLGAAVATTVPDAADPISGLPHAFSPWFLIPYLVLVIVQLCAINSVNLYSSGVTLQALGIGIERWQAVLLDSIVCLGVTTMIIFANSFNGFLANFLLFMIVWFAPWTAIFLVDYMIRRGRYDSRALTVAGAGIYRRRGGIHLPGVLAQVVGMSASAAWLHTSVFTGPLSAATDGSDLSIFTGFVCGGALYWLLARRTVADEADRTPPPLENDRLTVALDAQRRGCASALPHDRHEHPGGS
jgi:purine-cytosine permease-like protein